MPAGTGPAFGYLTAAGHAWQCNRGYRQDGAHCIPLRTPANAHIDDSGHGWECDGGFK